MGVKQLLFPGAHADVGGGYPTANSESMLSDGGLRWMVDELGAVGVEFAGAPVYDLKQNPLGVAHQPWRGKPYYTESRGFSGLVGHCSIAVRGGGGSVKPDPKADAAPYAPMNLPGMVCRGGDVAGCARCVGTV